MSACAMLTFNNVTPEAWKCVQTAAAQFGVAGADSGEQTVSGFTFKWSFAAATGILQIQCLDSPFWVSCSTIASHIHDAVEKCLSSHQLEMTPIAQG